MPARIKEYVDMSDSNQFVKIRIKLCKGKKAGTQQEHFYEKKELKLISKIATTKMYLFDKNGQLKRYDSAEQIIREFYTLRLRYYDLRKARLEQQLQDELTKLDAQVNFVSDVLSGKFTLKNWTDAGLLEELKKRFRESQEAESNLCDFLLDIRTRTYTQEELQES